MKDLIERACTAVGSATELADGLNVSIQVVGMWKVRKNIPARYWAEIEKLTKREVTVRELSQAAAQREAA